MKKQLLSIRKRLFPEWTNPFYNLLSYAGITRSGTKGLILSLTAPLAVYYFDKQKNRSENGTGRWLKSKKVTISSTFLRRYHPDQVQRVRNNIPSQSEEDSPSGNSYVIRIIISDKMENATFNLLNVQAKVVD